MPIPSNSRTFKSDNYVDPTFSKSFQERADAINGAYSGSQLQETWLDKFYNMLGFRSSYDVQMAEIEQMRREQLLQLKNIESEQAYNSESATAERMRAAGINPDLQGLSDGSEASEFTEPENPMDFSGLTTGKDFSSSIINAVTSSLGIYSQIQAIRSAGYNLDVARLKSNNALSDNLISVLRSSWNEESLKSFLEQKGDVDIYFPELTDDVLKDFGFNSRSLRKKIQRRYSSLINSNFGRTQLYNMLSDRINSENNYAEGVSKPYRNGDPDQDTSDIVSALKVVSDMVYDIQKEQARVSKEYFSGKSGSAQASAENAVSNYSQDYYSTLNGGTMAAYENASADFQKFVTNCKRNAYNKLVGENPSAFNLLLGLQLMGDTNFIGNSGINNFLDPVRFIK